MTPIPDAPQRSTPAQARALIEVEIHLRQAGRLLEFQMDEEQRRLARVVFRMASRVRGDRTGVHTG